jgi:outer membrane protein TolC
VSWAVLLLVLPAQSELTLDRAIELALERNEQVGIADRRTEQAEARVDRAFSFFLPEITLRGTYLRRSGEVTRDFGQGPVVFQSANSLQAIAALDLTLFDARGFPLYRAAQLDEEASKARSTDSKRRLTFEVAAAFLNALALDEVVRAAEQRREFAASNLGDAKARYQAQLVRGSDVTRAEVELANAEVALSGARRDREAAYLGLGFLIGAPIGGRLTEPADVLMAAKTSTGAPADLIQRASKTRPDLTAARRQAESLHALADEPLWRIAPSLELHGEVFAGNEQGFTGRKVDGFAGLTLTWNIYDGGERYADHSERTAAALIAELEAAQLERSSAVEIRQALVNLRSAREAVIQAENGAVQARVHAQQIAALYRQGLATALEASDANVLRYESEIALAQQRYGLAAALLDLRLAIGVDPLGREVS